MLLLACILSPAAAFAAQPATSNAFLNTIGVNTHIPYTDGEYSNIPMLIQDLQYLGITNVRDGISNGYDIFSGNYNGSAPITSFYAVAAAGVKFTFGTFTGGPVTTQILNNQLGLIQQVQASTPGSVIAVEGPNEINNWLIDWNGLPDSTCPQELSDALALQAALYSAVKATPALKGVSTVMFTGANAYSNADQCSIADHPNLGTTPGYANYDNQHPYPPNGAAPNLWVNPAYTIAGNTAPEVYTETGYSSSGGSYSGVNQYVQEMYGLDLFFDAAYYGVTRTYWYDLEDAYPPGSYQGDDFYGLFDYLENPKPLAIGLHNLHAILADTGTSILKTPAFTATGLPQNSYTLALGRRDSTSGDFVLWAEPQIWDTASGTQVPSAPASVTINLGKTYNHVYVFDPTLGTGPVQTAKSASEIVVNLTDHPLIVRAQTAVGCFNSIAGLAEPASSSLLTEF